MRVWILKSYSFFIFSQSLTVRLCYHVLVLSVYLPLKAVLFHFYPFLHWLWTNILRIMLTGNVDMIRVDKCLPGLGLGAIPLNKVHQLSVKIEL